MFVAMCWRSSFWKYPPSVVQSTVTPSARARASSAPGFTGPADRDSPSTIVVTPCRIMLSAFGSTRIV